MPLWFKKKKTESEPTPKTVGVGREPAVKDTAEIPPLAQEAQDVPLPLDPIVPIPRPAGLRSFKLPPVTEDAPTPAPPAPPSPAVSGVEPVSPVVSEPVIKEAPVSSQAEVSQQAPVSPVPSAGARPQLRSTQASVPPQESAVSAKNMPPGVKAILKPAQVKSRIQVADRTDIPVPKTEITAADMPNVSRADPKALYYLLMNGLYDVIFVLDDDGHVMDCNTRTEEIFGYSSDDVWNMPIEKIVYGMNSRMFSILKKNLTNKRHILIDARCFRSSGTSFLGEIGVSMVQLTRSQNVIFAIRNVERRKNSAEELRKYRAVINALPMPAFACDSHGRFEVMNPPVLKALGMVDEMEAQKKHFGEMLPDMVDCFQVAMRGEDVEETKEVTRPDGTVSTMELRLKPMRKGDEITGVAGTLVFS